jgi:hypothetical protein
VSANYWFGILRASALLFLVVLSASKELCLAKFDLEGPARKGFLFALLCDEHQALNNLVLLSRAAFGPPCLPLGSVELRLLNDRKTPAKPFIDL